MAKRKVVWLQIPAQDRLGLARFYADVFGFEHQDYPDMNYTTLSAGNGDLGIGIDQASPETPGTTVIYIESQDVQADLKAIRSKGGQIVAEESDIPGVGTMALFKDPAGNLMALGKFG